MRPVRSDYIFHPPSGSNVPGKEEANPYVFYPPEEVRRLLKEEKNPEEVAKLRSALKQWERIYVYPWYPWRAVHALRAVAARLLEAESNYGNPSVNVPYYQESDIPQGVENVLNILKPTDDDEDNKKFDYNRQGERPKRDIDTGKGDFRSPSEPVMNNGRGTVSPRGEGPDPDIFYPFPPTGGNLGNI